MHLSINSNDIEDSESMDSKMAMTALQQHKRSRERKEEVELSCPAGEMNGKNTLLQDCAVLYIPTVKKWNSIKPSCTWWCWTGERQVHWQLGRTHGSVKGGDGICYRGSGVVANEKCV